MDSVQLNLLGTAQWRKQKAERYPEDGRNLDAVKLLEKLASEVPTLRGSELENRYATLWETAPDGTLSEAESEYMRGIGFHRWPSSATEFVNGLVEYLESLSVETLED